MTILAPPDRVRRSTQDPRYPLSLGMNGRLWVAPQTRRPLADRGVEAHLARTVEAVSLYNRLREDGPVVRTLIHSTC